MNEAIGVVAGEAGEKAHHQPPRSRESEIQQLSSLLSANLNTSKWGTSLIRSGNKSSQTCTSTDENANTLNRTVAKTDSKEECDDTSTSHHGELSALVSPETMAMIQKAKDREEALAISRTKSSSSSCDKESEATTTAATAAEFESEVDIDLGSSSEVETDGSTSRRPRKATASNSSDRKQKTRLHHSKDSSATATSNGTRSRRNRRDRRKHPEDLAKVQLASAIDNKQLRRLPTDWDIDQLPQADDEDYNKDNPNSHKQEEQQQGRVRKRDLIKARFKHVAEVGTHAIHSVHEKTHGAGTVASAVLHRREAKVDSYNSDDYGPAWKPTFDAASLQDNIYKDLE
jgi:hypothetical protein